MEKIRVSIVDESACYVISLCTVNQIYTSPISDLKYISKYLHFLIKI